MPDPTAGRVSAHFFVGSLDQPILDDDDRHHAERVLRLRSGETVSVTDGDGGLLVGRFVAGGSVEPVSEVTRTPPAEHPVAVGFALVKGGRPEWIVQKLTECGVDRMIPFTAARSVVQWDAAKAARQADRLARVAREAAMQSRQVRLPVIEPVRPFADAAAGDAVLADLEGDPPRWPSGPVLVGPEGGWSPEERSAASGFVCFGRSVLRAETAAVAAGVLLTGLRAGVVQAAGSPISRAERSSDRKFSP
jgi:16S rRNA (uracil1498-N3)-methyltransferase